MDNPAPIALFVYNRPVHTQKTLSALLENDGFSQSDLYIFSDAPKKEEDVEKVNAVREIIKNIKGANAIQIIESQTNKGLADSIIGGISHIIKKNGKIIVLEDDVVTSSCFISYMNKALSLYQNDDKVMHVSAYIPPINKKLPSTFFYNQASCWGWGTWERAWEKFENKPAELIERIKNTKRVDAFNIDGACSFLDQLEQNARGEIYTWAIKWQAAVFLNNGLCLHPNKSLVQNIGLDWSGVHSGLMPHLLHKKLSNKFNIERIELEESHAARKAMVKFYNKNKIKQGVVSKIRSFLKNQLH